MLATQDDFAAVIFSFYRHETDIKAWEESRRVLFRVNVMLMQV